MNTEEFLKNASSRARNIGNNKYQEDIKNLNDKIYEMSQSINSKDEQLNLFKRNFTDMHVQFQEKNINITETTNKLTKYESEIKELNDKILNLNNINLMMVSDLEKNIKKINDEKEECINNLNIISNDKNDLQFKYDDIKVKYKETLSELNLKTNMLEDLNTTHTVYSRDFNLLSELSNTKTIELDCMKQELSLANNLINSLKIILIEKDDLFKEKDEQLKNTNYKMENNLFNNINLTELNEKPEEQKLELEQGEDIPIPVVNLIIKRGLKVSKR